MHANKYVYIEILHINFSGRWVTCLCDFDHYDYIKLHFQILMFEMI